MSLIACPDAFKSGGPKMAPSIFLRLGTAETRWALLQIDRNQIWRFGTLVRGGASSMSVADGLKPYATSTAMMANGASCIGRSAFLADKFSSTGRSRRFASGSGRARPSRAPADCTRKPDDPRTPIGCTDCALVNIPGRPSLPAGRRCRGVPRRPPALGDRWSRVRRQHG